MQLKFITPATPVACPIISRTFDAADVVSAQLTITGLGLFRAYINGQRIGRDYLTPGSNEYDAYLRAYTYDIDVKTGENRIDVWLGEGWYMGRFGLQHREKIYGDKYLLAARLTLKHSDGSATVIDTDDSWTATRSPIVQSSIYDGEERDDTREPGEAVACVPIETAYNVEEPISPPIRCVGEFKPTLIKTPKGENVLDFGQNAAGVFRFINRLPRGEKLRIRTGEVLQDGCFYNDNLRSAKSEYIYTSDGVVKEVEPIFTFYGFRYMIVEGPDSIDPNDYTLVALSSDLKRTLTVETGNPKLNRLILNTIWGQYSNFVDVPTDCPQRDERLGWTADTQVFVNTACYQSDCKAFYRKFMKDMRIDQQLYLDGDIPKYSPSIKNECGSGGAVWADAGTIVPWNVYQAYGDKELLAENYPMMRDYAEKLIEYDKNEGGTHVVFHLFTFGDWLAQDGLTPQSVFGGTDHMYLQGVYYYNSIRLTALAAAELGYSDDAAKYGALAEEIKAALLNEYITPAGRLSINTQTGYVLALYYGIYRDKAKLIEGFKDRLHRDSYRILCGFTGQPLMMPVLFENGMSEIAYRILLRESFPGWLYEVNLGATTIWERWNSLEEDGRISGTGMNSLNHYAYGSVCESLYKYVFGLRPAAPGWTSAIIEPHPDIRVGSASIAYDSTAGRYAVDWRINPDGGLTVSATVPEGACAKVILPGHPDGLVEELSGGTRTWEYTPVVNYAHPYSLESLTMDVLRSEKAMAALKRDYEPLYDIIVRDDAENNLRTISDVAQRNARYGIDAAKAEAVLKTV